MGFDNIGSFTVLYDTGALFPTTTVVGTPALAAIVGLHQSFINMREPVRILLRLNEAAVSGRDICESWIYPSSVCTEWL